MANKGIFAEIALKDRMWGNREMLSHRWEMEGKKEKGNGKVKEMEKDG